MIAGSFQYHLQVQKSDRNRGQPLEVSGNKCLRVSLSSETMYLTFFEVSKYGEFLEELAEKLCN